MWCHVVCYVATNILEATDISKMLLAGCGIVCGATCHKTRWSLHSLTSCGYWTWGSTVIDEELEVMVTLYKVLFWHMHAGTESYGEVLCGVYVCNELFTADTS